MNCQAVIFDLDGVITDTATYHYRGWKRLADELGIYFDETINERLRGIDRMASFEVILERSPRPYTPEEKIRCANRKNEYYRALLEEITPADILPGVMAFLGEIDRRGLKTALASASKNAGFVLDRLQLHDRFDFVVDAAGVRRGKPDPEMFLLAAEKLATPPAACIGIEDAAAGIEAIVRAGMFAVGLGRPETVRHAHLLLKDMTEYARILELIPFHKTDDTEVVPPGGQTTGF
jgi:beta-phosphoglucomutase